MRQVSIVVDDELAADYAGKLLTDEGAIARVMAENRTLGQRIREILRKIGEELRKIFGKSEPTLERAQALWDRAYEQATRNAENGQKNTAREGGEKTRYSTKNEVLAMPNIDWMEDDSSIKKQLRKHSDKISKTEPVAVVQYVHDKSESLVNNNGSITEDRRKLYKKQRRQFRL